jgi:putative NIF3 family GTP cyclohydrolase 1 type 2
MAGPIHPMVTLADIRNYFYQFYDHLDHDEGILFGEAQTPVRRVIICWMADLEAIRYAVSREADTIICHEILFYPSDVLYTGHTPEFLSWRVNHRRIAALTEGKLSVVRAHMTLDKVCILDDFAARLGLGSPIHEEPHLVKVYRGGGAVADYLTLVKKTFSMRCVRYSGKDTGRKVGKIGLPWGGLGISRNIGYMEQLVRSGCDLLIAGETENYAMRYAADSGVDMIETGHELSENPGLLHFSERFAHDYPQLDILFYENPQAFQYY